MSLLETSLRTLSVHGAKAYSNEDDIKGPLGLTLLFDPSEPLIDLVFVHGLGGGSRKTWSKTGDPYHYWPKEWLSRDPEFKNVRIHSFGYNANWGDTAQSFLNIHDFGKSLLGALYDSPHIRAAADTPLILVGHSMGGLVSKKAYVLARQDPAYQGFANRFYGMVFLATPHRGSDSAQLLNNILRASLPHGSKPYLGDLERGSGILQSTSDEFRHYSEDLQLRSFYETLKTAIGMSSVLIVDKASATLGYQNERTALINASHRGICKFDTPWDPNFVTVRNCLLSLVHDITQRLVESNREEYRSSLRSLQGLLGILEKPEGELLALEEIRFGESCRWFTSRPTYLDWRDCDHESAKTFWLSGKPATGKSVIAGSVIDELEELHLDCSYYFFRHNDNTRNTLDSCLRSIAYQMALISVNVRRKLLELKEDDVHIEKTDERGIWRKLFVNGVFQTERSSRPQYWVIDALDECNNHAAFFSSIAKLWTPFPLRIFLTSRHTSDFTRHFALLGNSIFVEQITTQDTLDDIRSYVETKIEGLPLEEEAFRCRVVDTIVKKSSGCFLWVALVLEELGKVYTESDIQQVLEEVPPDMDALYGRTLDTMSSTVRNKRLVHAILIWVVCAVRPLTTSELNFALKLDLGITVNALEGSITSDCGQLLYIDKSNKVQIIHQTVRDYLFHATSTSEFGIGKAEGHARLYEACLKYLSSDDLRPPRNYQLTKIHTRLSKRSIFQDYACVAFNEHLCRLHSAENRYLVLLTGFLKSNVLAWLEYLAISRKLYHVTSSAKDFKGFLEARSKYHPPVGEDFQCVDNWATDLIRVVAKFGRKLLQLPSAVYWLIPPFCPQDTVIRSQFAASARGITIQGLLSKVWDDRLGCFSYHNLQATAVVFTDKDVVVALSDRSLRVYNKTTLQESKRLHHVEIAKLVALDSTGRQLACSGRKYVRVLNLAIGNVLLTSEVRQEPLALCFGERDATLMAITRENVTSSWNLAEGAIITPRIRQNTFEAEDTTFRSPLTLAAFSPELNMTAVVYRGRPICLFDLDHDVLLGTCNKERISEEETQDEDNANVTPAIALVFNPKPEISLLAATYIDGDLALYDPCELSLITVVEAGAQALACSPDGRTLATGDSIGNIQLFEFETLRLMYRIRADEHQIKGIAFSSDGLRFCDVRGPQCNIWEPSVLVRTEFGETDSVSDVIPTAPKTIDIADQDDISEIMATVCHPSQHFLFCGNDNGWILVFDTSNAEQTQILWKHAKGVPISAILWVDDRNLLISADSSSRVVAYGICLVGGRWEIQSSLIDVHVDHPVNHLQASVECSTLLISSHIASEIHGRKPFPTMDSAPPESVLDLGNLILSDNVSSERFSSNLRVSNYPAFVHHIIAALNSKLIFLDGDLWVCSMPLKEGSRHSYTRHFFIPDDWLTGNQILLTQITPQWDCILARKDTIVVIKRGFRYEENVEMG